MRPVSLAIWKFRTNYCVRAAAPVRRADGRAARTRTSRAMLLGGRLGSDAAQAIFQES